MRYLISGYPRTRTAWFCALLNAHGSCCYHDALTNLIPVDIDAGIADPGLAMLEPAMAIEACAGTRLAFLRPDWRAAFEQWSGVKLSNEQVEHYESNVARYVGCLGTVSVQMETLNDDEAVAELVTLCTQEAASREIIQIFQKLSIEQHLNKARFDFANLALASTR